MVEDDLIVSQYFLHFMNNCIQKFKDEDEIWHISAWNYPIDPTGLNQIFAWPIMNCWGWATWKNKWCHFSKDVDLLLDEIKGDKKLSFDYNNKIKNWEQVHKNKTGQINTWAIFWYATIFKQKGLCVNPSKSLVHNIGEDGSGTNSFKKIEKKISISQKNVNDYKLENNSNSRAQVRIIKYLDKSQSWIVKIKNALIKRLY